ncbi:MAG: hypothetical protein M1546_08015 [Chloroflexi bacterium]|nr:hypothetical protein [Chloroflexota bacterium]
MADHCVRVILKYSDEDGTGEMVDALFNLEELVMSVVEEQEVGEYDGNDIGQGEFTMYMYGTDADRLLSAILPTLQTSSLAKSGYAVKRYGPPEEGVKEIRVDLS